MARIIVVDSQPLLVRGLVGLLDQVDGLAVVGVAETGAEAQQLVLKLRPDMILLDFNLPDLRGPEGVQMLLERVPAARIVVLGPTQSRWLDQEVLAAGATCYLSKGAPLDVIIDTLQRVASGEDLVRLPARKLSAEGLSARELQVLQAVSKGLSNRQVASLLGVTQDTVKAHLSRAMGKLGAHDRTHAVALLLRRGVLH